LGPVTATFYVNFFINGFVYKQRIYKEKERCKCKRTTNPKENPPRMKGNKKKKKL